MTAASRIDDMIAAVKAIKAPLFGLDRLRDGAALIEAAVVDFQEKAKNSDNLFLQFTVPDELAADLAAVERAAEAAFAFAVCRHLPAELGEYRERDDANGLIIKGYEVARRYGAARDGE